MRDTPKDERRNVSRSRFTGNAPVRVQTPAPGTKKYFDARVTEYR